MKLKLKRTLVVAMLCIIGFTTPVFAQLETVKTGKTKGPIFMGKVLEVDEKDKDSNTRIRVKGYIKGCEVYEEEIFAIISKDTKIITNSCNGEKKIEDKKAEAKKSEENGKKCETGDVNIAVGDFVFICLDDVMTKSIPPQVVAKRIQVTKVKS